ncbi:hypothetical protein D3C71_1384320 [compost metagenome]
MYPLAIISSSRVSYLGLAGLAAGAGVAGLVGLAGAVAAGLAAAVLADAAIAEELTPNPVNSSEKLTAPASKIFFQF